MSNDSEGKKLCELRVVDLRSELEKRSLEKTGIKIQLIERLVKALKDEGHDPETYEFKGVSKRLSTTARTESESDVMAEDAADKQDQDEEISDDHKKENIDDKLKADVNGTETEDSLNLTIEDDEDQLLNESNDETVQSAEKTNGTDLNKSQPNEDEEHKDEGADVVENRKGKSIDINTEDKDATSEREDSSATIPEPATASTGGDSSMNEEPTSGEVQAETGGGEVNSTSGGTTEADSANTSTSLKTEKDANSGRSLWISRLSTLTRATDLKHLFSKFGKVVGAKVVTNARTPSARCYGYVIMATTADAENCIKRVHKTELHGRFISVEKARSDKNDTANKEPRKFDGEKLDEKNEKKTPVDEKNKVKDIKEKDLNKDDIKEKEKASSDVDRSRKSRNEKNSKSRDREPDRRERHRSAGSGRSGKDRNKKKEDTSNEREREREKERDRGGERDRDRSRLRRRSSERDRTRRNDVLTFKQILEERGRQRQRERERTWREIENRKREIERIEIERRKVEQTKLLIKEQDRLRIERERLQRAKRETQQVLREVERMKRDIERKKVERDESLKKQREHQLAKEDLLRIERERLEMERLELKRQQMHLVEQARHATKRPADDRRDVYTDDRKRVATSSSSSHRFEAPPVPHYDVPSSPAPPGIISKKHDNYKSHESRNDYKMRDDFRSRDDVKTRDDYKSRDEYSKRDDYKRDRGDFAPPPPMLSGPSSHSSMPVKYSGPDSPYAGNVRAPSRDVRRDVIPSNVRGSTSSKDLRYSDRSGGPVDRSPPSAPSYRESDHRSSKSDIRSSRDHRYSDSSMKDSSHYSDRESGGWHSGPSTIKPFSAQSSGGSGRDNWLKNENDSMGGGGWSNTSSGHPQNSARWVNSPSSRLMSGSGGAYGGNSAGSSGGLAPPGVSGSSYAADQRYESYKSSMGSSLRKY